MLGRLKRLPTALTPCRSITTSTRRRQLDEANEADEAGEADEEPFEGFYQSIQEAHQNHDRMLAARNRSIHKEKGAQTKKRPYRLVSPSNSEHTKSAKEPEALDAGQQMRPRWVRPAHPRHIVSPGRDLAELLEYIRDAKSRMMTLRPRVTIDYLSPTNSHLLNLALTPCLPPDLGKQQAPDAACHKANHDGMLPQGHHLVYFPPLLPATDLLPDGTDPYHSPGEPFVRRMWAGGDMQWNPNVGSFPLDGRPAWCRETVGSPMLQEEHGGRNDMVFVNVRRMYFLFRNPLHAPGNLSDVAEYLSTSRDHRLSSMSMHAGLVCPLVETRTLVFLRKEYVARPGQLRKFREPEKPDFKAVPDAKLLFHFSALSHNAHAIHLDPAYARHQEGHKGLVVQGPLSVVLMLSAVRARLRSSLKRFSYRLLAPLYAGEELGVSLRHSVGKENTFRVSITSPDGRLAVKGTANVN